MSLCELCLSLDLGAISRSDVMRRFGVSEAFPANHDLFYCTVKDTEFEDGGKHLLIPYHKSLESLQANAKYCDLCRLVQHSVDTVLENMRKANNHDYEYPLSGYELWIADIDSIDGFQVLGFHDKQDSRGFTQYQLMGGFGLCVEDESQLGAIIRGRKIAPSPLSPSVVDKMKGWLRQCTEQHEHEKSTSLPTRVLELGENANKVFLRTSYNSTGEYACLSHCWGSVRPATLTLSTLEELSMGIAISELPQTFQDAIWLTHQLGIRYLWIDSLCIFQDDHDDWTKESARMCDVYRNSTLTIAASRAAGGLEGFLGTRLDRTYVSVPFHHAKATSGDAWAFALPLKHVNGWNQPYLHMEEEPLTGRGWALQERCLSRRTLHFSHSQIYFECERDFLSEDGFAGSQGFFGNMFVLDDYRLEWFKERCRPSWRDVVSLYSSRKLTCEDDKLPAVGGLAAHYSLDSIRKGDVVVAGNRYLAGLWFDDLLESLCWSIDKRGPPGVRPQTYRAPTWSWASVDGTVQYLSINPMNELAIVEAAHVDLESPESPFGKVTGGWAHLKAIRLRPRRKPDQSALCFSEDGVGFYIYCEWDSEVYRAPEEGRPVKPTEGETELFAIPLGWSGERDSYLSDNLLVGPTFLILKEVGHHVHSHSHIRGFERVGAGMAQWLSDDEGEGSGKEMLVRLIAEKWAVAKERGALEDILLL